MADKPVDEIVNVDAVLDALPGSPTSSDVYEATLPFSSDAVAAVAAKRALSGGGGALPAQWEVADDGGLTITISDDQGTVAVQQGSAAGASIAQTTRDNGATEDALINVRGVGGGTGSVINVGNGSAEGTAAALVGNGQLQMFTAAGTQGIEAWDDEGGVLRFALLPAGQPMVGVVAAPADGNLAASQVALWFDDTNGAAKLMIKGKSANGTVVTGAVALT